MHRYLIIVWNRRDSAAAHSIDLMKVGLASAATEWATAYEGPGAIVIHAGRHSRSQEQHSLHDNGGIVLGRIFQRAGRSYALHSSPRFDASETRKILDSGGRQLVDHYWGAYVALIYDARSDEHHILRGPTDNLPCYHASHGGMDLFFSDIEDCLRFIDIPLEVNREYMARWLIVGRLLGRECGMRGVEDLPGGERFTISNGQVARSLVWDPAKIAGGAQIEDPRNAALELRATVQDVVNAWASCYGNIGHNLSGGLDSSIVAGCLAQAPSGPHLTLLHVALDALEQEPLYLPGVDRRIAQAVIAGTESGDERRFACLVAERWSLSVKEVWRRVDADIGRLWHAPFGVSPGGYFSAIEADDMQIELARTQGIEAFFSGFAGDSVFFAPTQMFPAVDYAFLHGVLRRQFWREMLAASRLSRRSMWSVARKAAAHGVVRRPWQSEFSVLAAPTLLASDVTDHLKDDDFVDLWAKRRTDLPPGKTHHLGTITDSSFHDCAFHSRKYSDHINPLNSQPIWELALQIPTYTLTTGGISRGLARTAFADLLPTEVRKRQAKGAGNAFYQQLFRKNRTLLRDVLSGGLLMQHGYLDRAKVDAYFASDNPFIAVGAGEIFCYLSAEIWLQQLAALARPHRTAPNHCSVSTRERALPA